MRWRLTGRGWRLANSLQALAHQIDTVWPAGGPTDGTVGDLAHRARKSDHNPNPVGVVTALDVSEVVEDRGEMLVADLVASRDPRVKYIIHEGRIWRSYNKPGIEAWTAAKYRGTNAHLSHVHVSVSSIPTLYDDRTRWTLPRVEGTEPMGTLKRTDTGLTVELYQRALLNWNPRVIGELDVEVAFVDGAYGPKTEDAVKRYQRAAQLVTPFVSDPDPYGQIGALTAANLSRYVPVQT